MTAALLIGPSLIYIAAIMGFPLLFSLVKSLQNNHGAFVGLANYVRLLSSPTTVAAIYQTFRFVVVCAIAELFLGFAYALLLNRPFPLRGLVRTLFLLPLLFPPVVAALNWTFLFNSDYGFINHLLRFGFGMSSPPLWLADPSLAFVAVSVATIWRNTPFVMILVLAGLQSIDANLYESATIDGASRLQKFLYITLPMLRYVLLITVMLRVIDLFRVFDVVYIMTRGGPGGATEILSTRIYKLAFWEAQPSLAAALSYIALLITLVLLVPLLTAARRAKQ